MSRIFTILFLAIIVDAFFFPVSFTFLPEAVNSKIMIAAVGAMLFVLSGIGKIGAEISKNFVICTATSLVFSLICYTSTVINVTDDNSYATYFISFATWAFGAFGVCEIIRKIEGSVKLSFLTWLIVGVCFFQCVIALLIDTYPAVQKIVDAIFYIDKDFFGEINRLYGIGAALDTAGVRFSVALILLAHQLVTNDSIYKNSWRLGLCLSLYIAIIIMGNMIARTTIVGAGLGLLYMFVIQGMAIRDGSLEKHKMSFYGIVALLVCATIAICTVLYNTNGSFHSNMRFAFEGFFNWVETGVWRTDSTDKLNREMWIWPTDMQGWIIGTGIFGNFVYGTDIGWCRFVLYCGVTGMAFFTLFFLYCSRLVAQLGRNTTVLAILLFILVLAIWTKVATDLMFIYVLLFCVDEVESEQ